MLVLSITSTRRSVAPPCLFIPGQRCGCSQARSTAGFPFVTSPPCLTESCAIASPAGPGPSPCHRPSAPLILHQWRFEHLNPHASCFGCMAIRPSGYCQLFVEPVTCQHLAMPPTARPRPQPSAPPSTKPHNARAHHFPKASARLHMYPS